MRVSVALVTKFVNGFEIVKSAVKMSAKIAARREKESRWELIRKKHINCLNVTSETVRKFLNLDFVDESKMVSNSSGKGRRRLDPVVVMDLRHEMVRPIHKKLNYITH